MDTNYRTAVGLALAFRETRPRLIVVCGQMASGKSTVAAQIARRLDAHPVSADDVRRDLYEHGARDAFVPGFSATVYPEVERREVREPDLVIVIGTMAPGPR